jgi:uncharacterized protein (DUF362 family)
VRDRRRNSPDVAITKNNDETVAINECFELLNATGMINSNDVVVITPNWVQQQKPETGIVVGTESLRKIIQFVKKQNPKRIIIATGSGQKETSEIMKFSGFDKIIQEEGAEFIDLNHGPFIRVNLNHNIIKSTNLNKLFGEMTFLISFTQLKYHEEATISAAIKNIALGWPAAEEHGFPKKNLGIHDELHGFVSAMAETIPIDLSVVSASPVMIGTGPAKGIPKQTGLVLAGTDPVAVDTIAARLLGFKPQGVRYLFECSNKNIGISDVAKMNIKGFDLKKAEEEFSYGAYQGKVVID